MTHFAQHHPFYAGVIGMLFAGGLAFGLGAIIGAILNSEEGGDAYRGERG